MSSKTRKNGITYDDIIKFNEDLEIVSTSIVEITNIGESSNENKLTIFQTYRNVNTIE